jgi:hypothetical protein
MSRILCLAGLLCVAFSTALAQDIMTVAGGPETHQSTAVLVDLPAIAS